ncbi:MAG: DNA-protecting protein DprA [Alphaproteobacteria bacterium]|nr:DNA-protecting protein DprA [Alphaproteobacteria bacterium]
MWRDSEYYPERLAQFDDAPACINARGNLHLLTQPMIAIVGARNASINAQTFSHPQPGNYQSGSWCCGCRSGAPVVWAAILKLQIAGIVTRHYGNRVACIAQQSADK